MSDKDTSTMQSYIDSATGAVQGVIGSITGNTADKQAAENKKAEAEARNEASHAGANLPGGLSVSASGVARNNQERQDGSWNQTVGSGKEALGGLLGAESLKQEGQRQNAEGKAQEAHGQLSDLGKGIGDRVSGTVGGAVAGLTGDRDEEARRRAQHDQGKTLQRGVEADLDKQQQQHAS